jgi:four helix bundle protein
MTENINEKTETKKKIKSYKDLNVYSLSYSMAMHLFQVAKKFPKEETYSLIDQIRRSSRSIPANIAEGWAKRKYQNIFIKQLNDSNGSCEETKVWLDFAKDCEYLDSDEYERLINNYNKIGAMLNSLMNKWRSF